MTAAGVARGALALLLLVTAAAKVADLSGMAAIVDTYRVLPAAVALPAAVTVAASEAVVAGLLLTTGWRFVGCMACAALHTVYLGWSALALMRGLTIDNCGCFGSLWPRPLSPIILIEDGALILISLALARHYRRWPVGA
jgi:hypothetical protein